MGRPQCAVGGDTKIWAWAASRRHYDALASVRGFATARLDRDRLRRARPAAIARQPPHGGNVGNRPRRASRPTAGYETVDAAPHDPRADSPDALTFGGGPSRRFVGEATPRAGSARRRSSPAGRAAEPTGRWFGNQLGLWLTNEAHPALATQRAVARDAASTEVFAPTGQ
jgi:hypothetical protein